MGVGAPIRPYLALAADGSWAGSDGCNALAGRWTSAGAGAIGAVMGPQTLIWCTGLAHLGGWLTAASSAGFSGSTLVLTRPGGAVTGRLIRG